MIEKDILLMLTYLVGAGELALAVFFWVTRSGNEIRKVMALLALSTGAWSIFNGITSYTNPSNWVSFSLSLIFVFGSIIVTSLVHLALIFPYKRINLDKLHAILLYVPAVIFSISALFTNAIVSGYQINPGIAGKVSPGPLFAIYEVCISILFFTSLILMFIARRRSDGIHKKNTSIFFWSVLLGGLPAILVNLWFVFFGILVNPLIPVLFGLIWVIGTTYIIMK